MATTLIKGGAILSMDPRIGDLAVGDVLVEDDRIAAVAPSIAVPEGAAVIDAEGTIVAPGFVNAHMHTWQTALRGIAADWTISQYMRAIHAGLATHFRPDDVYVANLVGALAQLSAGTTTLVDWCHNNPTPEHTDAAVDGLVDARIRALFLHGSPKPDAKAGQRHFSEIPMPRSEVERLAKGRLAARDGRVTLGLAMLGPAYALYDVVRTDMALAREFGLVASMHVGGGALKEPDGFDRLVAEGLVDERCNIVHGNNLADDVLARLVEAGASFTVTAEVELQMGFGWPLTGRLRALGAPVSIGSDIETAMAADMFGVTRATLQAQRHADGLAAIAATGFAPPAISVTCREALGWATLDGARMAGLADRIGSITPGKQADLVLHRADGIGVFPVNDLAATLVLHAGPGTVDTVMVAGEILKRGGRLVHPGIGDLQARLAASGRHILSAFAAARSGAAA